MIDLFGTLVASAIGAGLGCSMAQTVNSRQRRESPLVGLSTWVSDAADSMLHAAESIGEVMESIATPRPQREVRELRDLAREENLDVVERGLARVERRDGALVATWNGEELTRFEEVLSA